MIKLEDIRSLVKGALQRRRQAIVFGVAKRVLEQVDQAELQTNSPEMGDEVWIRIESLSQLRSIVGGRFQKLKERWLAAGFPLREHRGDRAGKAAVDHEGWVELTVWVSRQGYRARLAGEDEPWLFEIASVEDK
jgi:hypothetical protein